MSFYCSVPAPKEVQALYDDLNKVWCVETCAPRLRKDWSEDNKTCGQCSVTAFLVQDLLGGKVYGIPLDDGGFHCYNEALGVTFDLTCEQFGDKPLNYQNNPEQLREVHFAKEEKRLRYELLKQRLEALHTGQQAIGGGGRE